MVGTGLKIARRAFVVSSIRVFLVAVLMLTTALSFAQVTTATLTGTVADRENAIIPGAKVTVTNKGNKFTRTVTSNGSGVFTFPGLDTGDYVLSISYKGFEGYKVEGIHLNPGDTRDITTIRLVPGAMETVVNVDTSGQNVVGDDGARDFIITSADLNKLSLEGREVTELLKILPGSAINNGVNGNSANSNTTYDPGTVQFGGATGSYSISGSPVNGAAIRSDGANLTDPGTGANSLQNINADATAEVKIQTANFGADNANGPMVINAVGKAGASDYHGSVYSYGRTGQLNSRDSIALLLNAQKLPDRFIYPGATLGGPVKIPGTNFNHAKKLTFFMSGEDYIQRNVYAYNSVAAATNHALVPTAGMRNGDFSPQEIAKYVDPVVVQYICNDETTQTICPNLQTIPNQFYGGSLEYWANQSVVPASDGSGDPISCTHSPGDCLAGHEDPGVVAQSNLIPLPNTPGGVTNNLGYNYTHTNTTNSDIYEVHGRLDYASGRSKYYVTYTTENGQTNVVQGENYFVSGQLGGVDTPGGTLRNTYTGSGSANWSIVFSPTLTNEAFISGLYSDLIDHSAKPGSLFNSAIGYPYGGAYDNGTKEYPNLNTYSSSGGYPIGIFPDFSYGALYNKTFAPGIGDNLSKQIGKHTVKVGVNLERPRINGTLVDTGNSGVPGTNGQIQNYYVGPSFFLPNQNTPTGEPYQEYHSTCFQRRDANCGLTNGNSNNIANYYIGEFQEYQQSNIIPHIRMHAWTTSMYATDDWKVLRNFSVNIGLRVEHIGRWIDDHGFGSAVFSPTDYANEFNNLNNPEVPLPGFRWHSIDSSIPISGFKTREFFYEPRVGFNWDVYGTGKTTLAGGWGQYRFRDGQQDAINSITASNGYRNVNVGNPGEDPENPNALNQRNGLTMAYVQSLHLSTKPGVETSTFVPGQYNESPNFASSNQTFYGVNQNDSQVPLTTNYSLTVTQQLPQALIFSVGYVGNHSAYLTDDNGGGPTISNVNAIPVGGLFQPDPNIASQYYGLTYSVQQLGSSNFATNDFRKYPRYGTIQVESHVLTANYNALQLTMEKTKGAVYIKGNYTWSKNFGEKGGYQNGNAGDSFNLRNDYGPLAYDRTNIANVAYNIDFGSKYHGYRALQQVVNGWQLSGITNLQSGPNLLAINYSTNFGLGGTIVPSIAGLQQYYISSIPYLGTPDVNLQPYLNCNPTAHLQRRQYISAACFAIPSPGGNNGPFHYPYVHGPAFFQSDATAVKDFHVKEKQTLEFRAAAFNFLNYKLKTFTSLGAPTLNLTYPLVLDTGFGLSQYNSGRRVVELAVKYSF